MTRTGWSGEVGYEVYLRDGSRGDELWERIMAAGKPHDIRPTGPSDIRRIEAGILNWGADITLEDNLYEVGLGWLVDEGKSTDYVGKDALRRIHEAGVSRKLVGVEIDGAPVEFNVSKWPVLRDGVTVGRVTSAIWSPRFERNLAYAMVPIAHADIGSSFAVRLPDGSERGATVVHKPFHDPSKAIPKG